MHDFNLNLCTPVANEPKNVAMDGLCRAISEVRTAGDVLPTHFDRELYDAVVLAPGFVPADAVFSDVFFATSPASPTPEEDHTLVASPHTPFGPRLPDVMDDAPPIGAIFSTRWAENGRTDGCRR